MMYGKGKGAMSDREKKMMDKATPKRSGKGAMSDRDMKFMKSEKRTTRSSKRG